MDFGNVVDMWVYKNGGRCPCARSCGSLLSDAHAQSVRVSLLSR
jgi:hypothetical protein